MTLTVSRRDGYRTDHRNLQKPKQQWTPAPSSMEIASGAKPLQFGHAGETVRDVQAALNRAGANPPLKEDALFGPKTKAAVEGFQRKNGLPVTGQVDLSTLLALSVSEPKPEVLKTTGNENQTPKKAPTIEEQKCNPGSTIPARTLMQNDEAQRNLRLAEQQKPCVPKTEQPKPFDPSKDAKSLHDAMKGGLFGAGTDEDKIYKTLEGKSKEQIDAIRKTYKDAYSRDLDKDLEGELEGSELERAKGLMTGDTRKSSAAAIKGAMELFSNSNWTGSNIDEIAKHLEGKSASEIEALDKEFERQTGSTLRASFRQNLTGDDRDRAMALMDGKSVTSDAAALRSAVTTALGTEEERINSVLEKYKKLPIEERKKLQDEYQRQYNTSLISDLEGDLSGPSLDRAKAMLNGDPLSEDAAKIREAVTGAGTDKPQIDKVLDGTTGEYRAKLEKRYKEMYGSSITDDLRGDLSGGDLESSELLLKNGKLSDVEKLHYAMKGAGTDDEVIDEVLSGKTRQQIAQLELEYEQRFGTSLRDDIAGDTSGREYFDHMMKMRGDAESVEEELSRMNERADFERSGADNIFGKVLVDSFTDSGTRLDANQKRANDYYKEAVKKGGLTEADKKRLSELIGYGNNDAGTYRDSRDAAAEGASTAAATAVAVAITAATAGSGAPVGAVILGAAVGAGTTKVAVSSAVQGRGYSNENAAIDFTSGAVDGALITAGGGAGQIVAKKLATTTAMRSTIAGATDGLLSGTGSSMTRTAVDPRTWTNGFSNGMNQVLINGTNGGAGGLFAGGVFGRMMKPNGLGSTETALVKKSFNDPQLPPSTLPQRPMLKGSIDDTDLGNVIEADFIDLPPSKPKQLVGGKEPKLLNAAPKAVEIEHFEKQIADAMKRGDAAALLDGQRGLLRVLQSTQRMKANGFDLMKELASRRGIAFELGGPTPSGYRILEGKAPPIPVRQANLTPGVANFASDGSVTLKGRIDVLANAANMPFGDGSIGSLWFSALNKNGRFGAMQEAQRVLEPGGLMVWQAGLPHDLLYARSLGFELVQMQRVSDDIFDMVFRRPVGPPVKKAPALTPVQEELLRQDPNGRFYLQDEQYDGLAFNLRKRWMSSQIRLER